MCSSSRADLSRITAPPRSPTALRIAVGDLVHRPLAPRSRTRSAATAIVVEQRRRLGLVHVEPLSPPWPPRRPRAGRARPRTGRTRPATVGGAETRRGRRARTPRQIRRPVSRRSSSSRDTSKNTTRSSCGPLRREQRVERLGLRHRARKAVQHAARRRRRAAPRRSPTSPITTSSGTSAARVHVALGLEAQRRAARPPPRAACRRWRHGARPIPAASAGACVPLPAPGGAEEDDAHGSCLRLRLLPQEAFVVAHEQVRFHLAHRVERHADHDQEAGAAEVERAC